jgi:predicted DCC family thiol-disulfide oxidoreductase YuxK
MAHSSARYIVLFDGVCNLCNRSVQFILKKDRKKQFLFGSLQGETGQSLLKKFSLPVSEYNSFVLIEGEKVYTRSTAALRVARHLGRGWQLLYAGMIIPRFIRDGMYNWIANNRYRWFGKRDSCRLPTPEEKAQFLD